MALNSRVELTSIDILSLTQCISECPLHIRIRRCVRICVDSLPDGEETVHIADIKGLVLDIPHPKIDLRMMEPENWIERRERNDTHMPIAAHETMNGIMHIFDGVV